MIDAKWQYDSAQLILRASDMYERTYGLYPVQLDGSTKAADYRNTGYLGGYGIGISVNCEDPVKAIKFLDYMASEEGQVLRSWGGIEGLNYEVLEDGTRYIPEEELSLRRSDIDYGDRTGVGNYMYPPFPRWGGARVVDSTGNYISTETNKLLFEGLSDIEKEVLEGYGVQTWSELYPSADELEDSDWGGVAWNIPMPEESGIATTLTECDKIVKDYLIMAIVSKPEEFDTHWAKMQEELVEAGAESMGVNFSELVKARVKAWAK